MRLQIIPSIDLRAGKVVRLKQGDFNRQIDYPVDPIEVARGFARDGAQWMHIVDLDGAKEGRPIQEKLVGEIARASGLLVEVGGGVRSADDVLRLLEAGATRVVVGTKAIEDWNWFTTMVSDARFAQRLVLAVDAKNGIVATRGWESSSGKHAIDLAVETNGMPVAALLYTDVAHDGMMDGPNVAVTRELAKATDVPVIASGGVGNLEHVKNLVNLGIWGVIIGRSLYEGAVNLGEAVRVGSGITSIT